MKLIVALIATVFELSEISQGINDALLPPYTMATYPPEGPSHCYSCGQSGDTWGKMGRQKCAVAEGNYCHTTWTSLTDDENAKIERGCLPWYLLMRQVPNVAVRKWPRKKCFMLDDNSTLICICRRKNFCNKALPLALLESFTTATPFELLVALDEEECNQRLRPSTNENDTNDTYDENDASTEHRTDAVSDEQPTNEQTDQVDDFVANEEDQRDDLIQISPLVEAEEEAPKGDDEVTEVYESETASPTVDEVENEDGEDESLFEETTERTKQTTVRNFKTEARRTNTAAARGKLVTLLITLLFLHVSA